MDAEAEAEAMYAAKGSRDGIGGLVRSVNGTVDTGGGTVNGTTDTGGGTVSGEAVFRNVLLKTIATSKSLTLVHANTAQQSSPESHKLLLYEFGNILSQLSSCTSLSREGAPTNTRDDSLGGSGEGR